MGCDIHIHVEVRCNGRWEHYACPRVEPWYALFGIMAGVRIEVDPIVPPKGVPDDMSLITRLDYEMRKAGIHTPSWFNEDEIDQLVEWLKEKEKEAPKDYLWDDYQLEAGILRGTYMFGNRLTGHKHHPDCQYMPKECDAVRLVFWFDN